MSTMGSLFNTPITIILDWSVSIRPCELKCIAQILNIKEYKTSGQDHGYQLLMSILTRHMSSILDVAKLSNAEREGLIFTPEKDLPFSDIEKLQSEFNEFVYWTHKNTRTIDCHNGHYYIRGYVNDAIDILSTLSNYTIDGIPGYSHTIESTVSKVAFFGSYNEEK